MKPDTKVYSCSGCGQDYNVIGTSRRPKVSRDGSRVYRNFCEKCRDDGMPGRLASRDYWRRKTNTNSKGSGNGTEKSGQGSVGDSNFDSVVDWSDW